MLDIENTTNEMLADNKLIIYQLLVRLFGNKIENCLYNGSLLENGCGKFADITELALIKIKELGISHVWYTGVLDHATSSDYSSFDLSSDDQSNVKGRAGSPYAIRDYYNVSPDLATDVTNRMVEFEELIKRTHNQGLNVIIDFVPNHVARNYSSKSKPAQCSDLGEQDDKSKSFSPENDFYYILDTVYRSPISSCYKSAYAGESPAKASGNDVFSATPGLNDWYDTVKLNYGVDYLNNKTPYFDPIPPLWKKMINILVYWAKKGVDGFRCDMVEMVPLAFWSWSIRQLKYQFPNLIFIGEIYNPALYSDYIKVGGFNFLYDKVGLYNELRNLIESPDMGDVRKITSIWKYHTPGISNHMLRFLENHDEQRIASTFFAGNPWFAKAAMVLLSTLSSGPIMMYFGQEVGETAIGAVGFSGDDGRTSIYDYTNVPHHQRWMNYGKFDGGRLSNSEKSLRLFYKNLFVKACQNPAVKEGQFFELLNGNSWSEGFNGKTYAFLRYTAEERVLIIANFEHGEKNVRVFFPDEILELFGLRKENELLLKDLLSDKLIYTSKMGDGIYLNFVSTDALILKF
ncbi:alpha-amylase family protein [Olivibacter jilunii]|uniref:alpha-amylase family protein n=1 Tax=Olivibacter jilunii TaxID=985016 RepID=UPI001F5E9282|nr:alpha-amylase family protein [Olivibacter jilunii]